MDQRRFDNPRSKPFEIEDAYLSADEAAERLGVKHASLYSYASRGLVRSIPGPQGRARRYARADVERLRTRHDARKGHGAVAASALRWGEPVLDSAITEITPEGPKVRGRTLVSLAAKGVSFERVAQLLWTDVLPEHALRPSRRDGAVPASVARLVPKEATPLAALSLLLPALALRDRDRFGAAKDAEHVRAVSLLWQLAAGVALPDMDAVSAALSSSSVAAALARAGGARRGSEGIAALDAALVLSSDHELNASTFAARIAASAGADLYACLSAGLSALSGPRHGGACDRVEALVLETGSPKEAARIVRERTGRGDAVPGFSGHPLYPSGDPRTPPLLSWAERLAKKAGPRAGASTRTLFALIDAVKRAGGEPPALDVGLVAVASAAGMRPGSAAAIFGVGRAAGWIAHILEQRESPALLRPRARFGRRLSHDTVELSNGRAEEQR